jgi:hypothetical protein
MLGMVIIKRNHAQSYENEIHKSCKTNIDKLTKTYS